MKLKKARKIAQKTAAKSTMPKLFAPATVTDLVYYVHTPDRQAELKARIKALEEKHGVRACVSFDLEPSTYGARLVYYVLGIRYTMTFYGAPTVDALLSSIEVWCETQRPGHDEAERAYQHDRLRFAATLGLDTPLKVAEAAQPVWAALGRILKGSEDFLAPKSVHKWLSDRGYAPVVAKDLAAANEAHLRYSYTGANIAPAAVREDRKQV